MVDNFATNHSGSLDSEQHVQSRTDLPNWHIQNSMIIATKYCSAVRKALERKLAMISTHATVSNSSKRSVHISELEQAVVDQHTAAADGVG